MQPQSAKSADAVAVAVVKGAAVAAAAEKAEADTGIADHVGGAVEGKGKGWKDGCFGIVGGVGGKNGLSEGVGETNGRYGRSGL